MARVYYGRIIALAFTGASLAISLRSAWQPELGNWQCFQLICIAAASEAIKFCCNYVIFIAPGARWWHRIMVALPYVSCICASVYLMNDLIHRTLLGQEAAAERRIEGVAADRETAKGDIREAKKALEDALTDIQPGIKSADAIRAIIKADKLNRQELVEYKAELEKAEKNERLNAKVGRLKLEIPKLEEKLLKSSPERSRSSPEVQGFTDVHVVHERTERLNILGLVAAAAIEAAIFIGFLADSIGNREPPAPVPIQVAIAAAVNIQRTMNAERFEAWLATEWRTKKGRDGWLEGTQHAWAVINSVSVGFVHAQLKALIAAGKIEKAAMVGGGGKTRIRFLAAGTLKMVR